MADGVFGFYPLGLVPLGGIDPADTAVVDRRQIADGRMRRTAIEPFLLESEDGPGFLGVSLEVESANRIG